MGNVGLGDTILDSAILGGILLSAISSVVRELTSAGTDMRVCGEVFVGAHALDEA